MPLPTVSWEQLQSYKDWWLTDDGPSEWTWAEAAHPARGGGVGFVAVQWRDYYRLYQYKQETGTWKEVMQELSIEEAQDLADVVIDDVPVDKIEEALKLLASSLPSIDEIGTVVGAAVGASIRASSMFGRAVIREAGPALVESVELTYQTIANKLDGKEAGVIASFTVGLLVIITGIFLFHEISRGPSPQ